MIGIRFGNRSVGRSKSTGLNRIKIICNDENWDFFMSGRLRSCFIVSCALASIFRLTYSGAILMMTMMMRQIGAGAGLSVTCGFPRDIRRVCPTPKRRQAEKSG